MISFLICALNEEKHIKATVNTIYESIKKVKFIDKFEIVIVNDGSTDLTEEIILNLQSNDQNIIYCKNNINLGYGKSVNKGLKKIKYPKFMVLPGDNDMTMGAITSALKHLNSADLIMVFPVNTDNRSKGRNIISILYRLIYLIFFDCYVNYINSPSICPTEKVKSLKLQSSRFSIISEILTKLLHSDITYCEVPAFWDTSLRKRTTLGVKNLLDVFISFIKLFLEMKIFSKNKFSKKSIRKNIHT
jgi:glycosyltransferase involved in cell wall biosynthesis